MKGLGVFFIVLFLVGMQSCSPKQKTMLLQNPEINANNIVDKLAQQIQHYKVEPVYFITYDISWCFAEILVNDIPVYKNFSKPLTSSVFSVNHAIFKSGIQKVTYRLYPLGKLEGDDEVYNTLKDNSNIKLSVDIADNVTKEDLKFVKEYSAPLMANPNKESHKKEIFAGTGKTFYEGSFTFEAEVPYTLEGFENAQDLRKMDKKELEAKLLKKYREVKDIYQTKDYDNIARTSYMSLNNQFIAQYRPQKDIQEIWMELMEVFKLKSFEMQPIENYKMVFYADGKLVALVQKSTDPRVRGNTSLWAKFDRGEGTETLFLNSYFYILKGESDFKVY